MQINLEFERDTDDRWYAIVPTWEGDRSDLEMVMGADTMLDIISKNFFEESGRFSLNLDTDPEIGVLHDFKVYLRKIDKNTGDFGGSFYMCYYGLDQEIEVWLCNVCEFVFGEFPPVILIN